MNAVKILFVVPVFILIGVVNVGALDVEFIDTIEFDSFFDSTSAFYNVSSIRKDENYHLLL